MAVNSIRVRGWNSGPPHNNNWLLSRDGASVTTERMNVAPNFRRTHEFKTIAEAKRVMDIPNLVCRDSK